MNFFEKHGKKLKTAVACLAGAVVVSMFAGAVIGPHISKWFTQDRSKILCAHTGIYSTQKMISFFFVEKPLNRFVDRFLK